MSEVKHYFWVADGMSEASESGDTYVRSTDFGAKCHSNEVYFGSWKRTEEERDEALSQLAALREELAQTKRTAITEILALNSTLNNQAKELAQHDSFEELYNAAIDERDAIQQRLADAERRNAVYAELLNGWLAQFPKPGVTGGPITTLKGKTLAALNHKPEAASHDDACAHSHANEFGCPECGEEFQHG